VPCLLAFLAVGCRSGPTPQEIEEATLFVPPVYKRVERARWCFSDAERSKALAEHTRRGANSLLEVLIDDSGQIVRLRVVRTQVQEIYHDIVLEHVGSMKFSADPTVAGHRAFYLPLDYDFSARFEWL
jgi:hypothetical protein